MQTAMPVETRKHSDLIYLDGPLTADAILKCIHQRFLEQKNVVRVATHTHTHTPLRKFSPCSVCVKVIPVTHDHIKHVLYNAENIHRTIHHTEGVVINEPHMVFWEG